MARQWKVGDFAHVVGPMGGEYHAIRSVDGWEAGVTLLRNDEVREVRPLVVIDPEDTLQVQRLVEEFWANGTDDCNDLDAMTKGLRSLVTDPKPEEPQGLGAVVELVGGEVLVRTEGQRDTANWADKYGDFHWWADIDVARVLSEGWSE